MRKPFISALHTEVPQNKANPYKDPAIQQYLRDRSLDGDDIETLQEEADEIKEHGRTASNYVRVFDALLTRVWRDIYDGITVDRTVKQV